MVDYRVTWSATGGVIGYIHNVDHVVSGADITFFFDAAGNVLFQTMTPVTAFVQI